MEGKVLRGKVMCLISAGDHECRATSQKLFLLRMT